MCRRTLFLSSNVAVANWPTLRLQCHRRKDFWKDLFKRASSESLLLVCLIYFLAWFYSWKIECDVRARCILLLKKVRKRDCKIFKKYSWITFLAKFSQETFFTKTIKSVGVKIRDAGSFVLTRRWRTWRLKERKWLLRQRCEYLNSSCDSWEWAYLVENKYV